MWSMMIYVLWKLGTQNKPNTIESTCSWLASHSSQERFEANVHQICSALQAKRSTGVSLYV